MANDDTLDVVVASMPGGRVEMAAAVVTTSRQVGGVLGISVMGLVVQARSADHVAGGASATDAYIGGVSLALLVAAGLLAAGAVAVLVLLRGASRSVNLC